MRLALRLAARGAGWVSPNPMVGAVVVRDGEIVGRGWHRRYGAPHAEVEALAQAGERARGATLYVTLEPCHHQGLTPPCTQAVLAAGVSRVVIAMEDPNPHVTGGGAQFLAGRGLEVRLGVLEDTARRLNEAWIKWVTSGLPFVIAKAACSLDGRIATVTGESKWLTGVKARALGHRLRHECDAVLVGVGTVLADDPQLTVRLAGPRRLETVPGQGRKGPSPAAGTPALHPVMGEGVPSSREAAPDTGSQPMGRRHKDPLRIVLDSTLRLPTTARLLHLDSPAPTLIATTPQAPAERVLELRQVGAEVLILPEDQGRVALRPLLERLGKRKITSLLVEGGSETLGSFFDARLVDRFYFFYAPKILGGKEGYPMIAGQGVRHLAEAHLARELTIRRLGQDILITGRLR
ncbi:MAG: bifunctional diaminohydroxyphosphoribosylaminopyrimidine deaminase/5-amino-6-(5-phosphoribosylamino)uracil reductase RibD [Syntrophobacterales bacterium]|nr:bifunctional diaminohydroxyphosphoribosylaminopyrimidine deaminase/5-amino-6-(5-phosphoribosylamino)uracil reductase RibD [Syntrophobacterales bacterium]